MCPARLLEEGWFAWPRPSTFLQLRGAEWVERKAGPFPRGLATQPARQYGPHPPTSAGDVLTASPSAGGLIGSLSTYSPWACCVQDQLGCSAGLAGHPVSREGMVAELAPQPVGPPSPKRLWFLHTSWLTGELTETARLVFL